MLWIQKGYFAVEKLVSNIVVKINFTRIFITCNYVTDSKMIISINKDESVHRFALIAISGEFLERKREQDREIHTIWRGKHQFEVILIQIKYFRIHNISIHINFHQNRFIKECVS